jgi:hypothetical protein
MPLAHSGHVLVDISIFLGPLLVAAIWLAIAARRDRRSGRNSAATRKKERNERAGHLQ